MSRQVGADRPEAAVQAAPAQDHAQVEVHQPLQPDDPLPRPERRRKRPKADRGLPPDDQLQRLAAEYLQFQRRHYPELVRSGLLAEPTEEVIDYMVEDFKHRHRTGSVELTKVLAYQKVWPKLAGSYNRYSCDNSSPTSNIDQMINALEKSSNEARFIPWDYVFADYSVSGLDSGRQGYTSYKQILCNGDHLIETTYVDDFSRASRDEIEWWKLAHQSRRLGKRMIGASDGFDLSAPDWDLKVSLYGIFSRLFLKSLREKVMRGQKGAARRGTCVGRPPLGFTRCPLRDQQGNVIRDHDGLPKYRPCIDPITAPSRKLMYELFVNKRWSTYEITKHFNQVKVDGWGGWTESAIRTLLWSPSAIGVFIWNRRRREYNFEEEKWVIVKNPRKEWVIHYDPALALAPMDLWIAARKLLAEARRKCPLTGRKLSRNQKSATTLFSGTLDCDYCNRELLLRRSAGKYKVMGCLNG
jgi:DNA invertase Pin-like site-specific DNA recombinase